ncbi:hypothetical protein METHP14_870008 [Pseudomonas sp. P14-2025]
MAVTVYGMRNVAIVLPGATGTVASLGNVRISQEFIDEHCTTFAWIRRHRPDGPAHVPPPAGSGLSADGMEPQPGQVRRAGRCWCAPGQQPGRIVP